MLTYPNIDPVALQIGSFAIRWYSLAYIIGIVGGWWLAGRMNRRTGFMNAKQFDAILSWVVVGIIAGGRLGYVIFYKPLYYISNPLEVFYLWEGGMSFHGGMLGTIISMYIFCRVHKLSFINIMDMVAPVVPIGLCLGRLANFINGELYGRPTTSGMGMIFPHSDGQPRHPSQLYEAGLEGFALFLILGFLFWQLNKWKNTGYLSGMFLIFYGIFRITAELFREPDAHLGYFFQYVTMGQILSLPMILLGIYFVIRSRKHVVTAKNS